MSKASVICSICFLSIALTANSRANGDITSDLLHHWKFDETSGTRAIDSVSGNDATLNNWAAEENRWVPGQLGGALDFGDVNNYAITDSPISLDEYTIAFWLNVTTTTGINPRVVGPIDGLHHWAVIGNENRRGVGFYYDHGAVLAQDPNPPVLGEWEHYAIALDRAEGQATIYRDGDVVRSASFNDDLPLDNWIFGHQGDVNNHGDSLNGLLDDLRIYERLLDPGDVFELTSLPFLQCDSDGDFDCDNDDIDAMYDAFGSSGQFDYDGNGTVGPEDVAGWLADATIIQNELNPGNITFIEGDVNLDGSVNSADLGFLLNNFGSDAGTANAGVGWGGGDITADGRVDSTDLGRMLNNFGFQSAAAVSVVPEPSLCPLFLLFFCTAIRRRR